MQSSDGKIHFSCNECGTKFVATTAQAGKSGKCKNCGSPIDVPRPKTTPTKRTETGDSPKKKYGLVKYILASVIAVWIIGTYLKSPEPNKSASNRPNTNTNSNIVYNSSWEGSVRQVEDWFKKNLKDPKSVDVIDWYKVKKNDQLKFYIVKCDFRAKNSFGGYVVHRYNFYIDFSGNMIHVRDFANGNTLVWGK